MSRITRNGVEYGPLVGNLVRSDTHEIKCKKWKGLPRSEERFAGRMSNAERISYYYGAPGKPLVCVTCGSKELVLALPPLCATCLKRASVVEILKRLPLLDGPEVREIMKIIEEAFSALPHEPSARCVDTCNNPLECREEWDEHMSVYTFWTEEIPQHVIKGELSHD